MGEFHLGAPCADSGRALHDRCTRPANNGQLTRRTFGPCPIAATYVETCIPMCIGFAIGDLVYFWAARLFGYSEPPVLCVLVITFTRA